jgi:hypothetical protein
VILGRALVELKSRFATWSDAREEERVRGSDFSKILPMSARASIGDSRLKPRSSFALGALLRVEPSTEVVPEGLATLRSLELLPLATLCNPPNH